MVIEGASHLFKKRKVSERATCPHCGCENRVLRSYSAWEFFHAMFIPLVPLGTVRAVLHCPTCLQFYKFALKGRKLKAAVAERREAAFSRPGDDVNATLDDVAAMAHLGDFEGVQSLLEKLTSTGAAASIMSEARFLDLQGFAGEAEVRFREAVDVDASSGTARFWLGRFLLHQGEDAEAVATFRQAAEISPDCQYLALLEGMIDLRKRQKKWDGLATIMAEALCLCPDMANERAFSKLFAKACRKSGRAMDISNPYAGS